MYEALVARVRYHIQKANFMGLKEAESTLLLEEAADAIEELSQIAAHYEEENKGWWLAACDAKEKIKELQQTVERYRALAAREQQINMDRAAKLPRWISVEERLPEDENARYLVASDLMRYGLWVSICYFARNLEAVDEYDFAGKHRSGFYFSDDEYGYIEKDDVRYWMPLPEPPDHIREVPKMVEPQREDKHEV